MSTCKPSGLGAELEPVSALPSGRLPMSNICKKEAEVSLNTSVIRIYRSHPYLLVGGLEEVGVEGKKDPNNRIFSMGILGSHRKVPIRWLQGDSEFPFGVLYFICK
jgi:hypothetical protein